MKYIDILKSFKKYVNTNNLIEFNEVEKLYNELSKLKLYHKFDKEVFVKIEKLYNIIKQSKDPVYIKTNKQFVIDLGKQIKELTQIENLLKKAGLTGLNAPRHKGIAKEALDDCGRLKKGYKFENGTIIKIEKPTKKTAKQTQIKKTLESKTINKIHSLIKDELKENGFIKPIKRKYRLGDKWREDFDYKGLLEYGLKITDKTPETTIKKLYNSFVDVNYHTIAKELWNRLVELKSKEKKPVDVKPNSKYDFIYEVSNVSGKYVVKTYHELPKKRGIKLTGTTDTKPKANIYHVTENALKQLQKQFPDNAYGEKHNLGQKELLFVESEKPNKNKPKKISKESTEDKNKIKGAYYVLNSDNKLELHFENVSDYKVLPDEIKKDIKSSFIWGRKRKAWVSRSKGGHIPFMMQKYIIDYKGANDLNDFETQLNTKTEKAKKRAERFETYANNAVKRAENLQAEFNKYRKDWSWLTQPITPGAGGRAFASHKKKVMDKYERGFEEYKKSDYYKDRAATSLKTAEQSKLKSIAYLEDKVKKLTKEIAKREEVLSKVDFEKLKKETKWQIWYDAYLNNYKLALQALPFYQVKLEEERENNKGQIDPRAKINKKEFADFLKDKYGLKLLTFTSQKYAKDRMYYFKTDKDLPPELYSGWAAGNMAQKYSKYLQELMNDFKKQNQKGLNQPYRKVANFFKGISNAEMIKKLNEFLKSISGNKYFNKDLKGHVLVDRVARKKIIYGGGRRDRIDSYKATAIMYLPYLITTAKLIKTSDPKPAQIKRYKAKKVYTLKSHIEINNSKRDYILIVFETEKGLLKYFIQEVIKKVASSNGKAQKEQSASKQLSDNKDNKKKIESQGKTKQNEKRHNRRVEKPKQQTQINGLKPLSQTVKEEFDTFQFNDDLGTFLGEIERKPKESLAITVDADQGAGKTRFLFQLSNMFANNGYKNLFYSLEEHPESKLFANKVEQYLTPKAKQNIFVRGDIDSKDLEKNIPQFDTVLIDSWNKVSMELKRKENKRIDFDYDFRKKYDGKLFVTIFQRTISGTMRGGSASQFDGDIILKIKKLPDWKDNYVYYDKNRYMIDNYVWNIHEQRLYLYDDYMQKLIEKYGKLPK